MSASADDESLRVKSVTLSFALGSTEEAVRGRRIILLGASDLQLMRDDDKELEGEPSPSRSEASSDACNGAAASMARHVGAGTRTINRPPHMPGCPRAAQQLLSTKLRSWER